MPTFKRTGSLLLGNRYAVLSSNSFRSPLNPWTQRMPGKVL